MKVIKSSGVTQDFDESKIINVLEIACRNTSVDPYEVMEIARPMFIDNMTTEQIQRTIIKVAASNITKETPDYQYVASNLEHIALRKKVYGQSNPIPFIELISRNVNLGLYDSEILSKYTAQEISELEKYIDHDKDFKFTYAGTMQLISKYMVKDRSSGIIYETPQYAFMLIGMCLFQEESENRLEKVIEFYEVVSDKQLSLPTPILSGVRTPTRQFSSCVVIDSGDSLDSINETNAAIVKYISKRAGIGINAGMYRAEGSKIGFGEVVHTGVIPFWKTHLASVKSCSQGGIRGGSATLYYPMWHLELEKLLVLKNNKGIEENRIRHLDYGVQINDLMIERLINDDYITLFSPHEIPGMYDAYFSNEQKFRDLYEAAEKDTSIRKKRIKASEVFSILLTERANTARIYPFFVDNVNRQSSFIRETSPIRLSNLCAEITLPTSDISKDDGEIALCTLSAFVLDSFDYQDQEQINKIARVAVRALDALLDYQDYPVEKALIAKKRRALGVGVTNYAASLASQFLNYDNAQQFTHELFERLQYGLIKASVDLAKEKGPCELYHETKYSQGLLPIDWYNKNLDKVVKPEYVCDWESLRKDLKQYGIRNSTLSALMPCESSSQVSNSTNGIEPPRKSVTAKASKDGSFNQVVPNIEFNEDLYDYAWDLSKRGMKGYLTQAAIMQKFVDQSISVNTYYTPSIYEKSKVPMSVIMDDMLYFWSLGGKTMYYHNTNDGNNQDESKDSDCESCKL